MAYFRTLILVGSFVVFGDCNKSANEQCLNRILPGKQLSDVKWNIIMKEAFQNNNHDYQCFILCGLSNLGILRPDGIVETEDNPLVGELGDIITECTGIKESSDGCINAKESTICLFKHLGPLKGDSGVGKIIKEVNEEFKNSGRIIKW